MSIDFSEAHRKNPKDRKRIENLEKRYRKAQVITDLKKHDGMRLIIEELQMIIDSINMKLISGSPMTEQQREVLLADRERCEWMATLFDAEEMKIKSIEKVIKKL